MKGGSLNVFIIVGMLLFGTTLSWAKADGYKIVLASYPNFDSAKKGLATLEQKLGKEDFSLREKEDYEFVARASGRAFIIGIEPIGDKKAVAQVLKRYKRWYPQAYSDKYYGPTAGSVFIDPVVAAVENSPAVESESAVPVKSTTDKNVIQSVSPSQVPATLKEQPIRTNNTAVVAGEGNGLLSYVKVALALALFVAIIAVFRRKGPKTKKTGSKIVPESTEHRNEKEPAVQQETAVQDDRAEESDEETVANEVEPVDEELVKLLSSETAPDIFYRLSENMFFVTLIRELKAAADHKDAQRCRDLMDEVTRYQKNFKHSAIIDRMDALVENKAFERLSALIGQEIPSYNQ